MVERNSDENGEKKDSRKRIWFMLGAVLLIFVLLGTIVDIKDVFNILGDTDWGVMAIGVGCLIIGILLLTLRWRFILDNEPVFLDTLSADGISYSSKFFLPVPLPVLRVVALSLVTPISISEAAPGVLIDRLMVLIMRLLALALTILLVSEASLSLGVILGGVLIVFALFGLTIWLARHTSSFLPRLTKIAARLPNMSEERLQRSMSHLQHGLTQVESTRKLVVAQLISLVMWTFFLLFYALGFPALGLGVNNLEAFTMAAAALVVLPPLESRHDRCVSRSYLSNIAAIWLFGHDRVDVICNSRLSRAARRLDGVGDLGVKTHQAEAA